MSLLGSSGFMEFQFATEMCLVEHIALTALLEEHAFAHVRQA